MAHSLDSCIVSKWGNAAAPWSCARWEIDRELLCVFCRAMHQAVVHSSSRPHRPLEQTLVCGERAAAWLAYLRGRRRRTTAECWISEGEGSCRVRVSFVFLSVSRFPVVCVVSWTSSTPTSFNAFPLCSRLWWYDGWGIPHHHSDWLQHLLASWLVILWLWLFVFFSSWRMSQFVSGISYEKQLVLNNVFVGRLRQTEMIMLFVLSLTMFLHFLGCSRQN